MRLGLFTLGLRQVAALFIHLTIHPPVTHSLCH